MKKKLLTPADDTGYFNSFSSVSLNNGIPHLEEINNHSNTCFAYVVDNEIF